MTPYDESQSNQVFSNRQWRWIFTVVPAMAGASWLAADAGWIDILEIGDPLFNVSVVLLGFSLTVFSLMVKAADKTKEGSWLHAILFTGNVYEALIRNVTWLITMFFINTFIGFILVIVEQEKIDSIPLSISVWLQAALAAELTFTYLVMWYAVKRYIGVVGKRKNKRAEE